MIINAFIVCGTLCLIAQIIYDNTKLTPGHITSLFVVIGAFLDLFNVYDKLIEFAGMGASIPITSFGHSLIHGSLAAASKDGVFAIITGMFDKVTPGIAAAIICAFFSALIWKPKS